MSKAASIILEQFQLPEKEVRKYWERIGHGLAMHAPQSVYVKAQKANYFWARLRKSEGDDVQYDLLGADFTGRLNEPGVIYGFLNAKGKICNLSSGMAVYFKTWELIKPMLDQFVKLASVKAGQPIRQGGRLTPLEYPFVRIPVAYKRAEGTEGQTIKQIKTYDPVAYEKNEGPHRRQQRIAKAIQARIDAGRGFTSDEIKEMAGRLIKPGYNLPFRCTSCYEEGQTAETIPHRPHCLVTKMRNRELHSVQRRDGRTVNVTIPPNEPR